MIILQQKQLVLVGILYYRPDYPSLIQEFHWQTEDIIPSIPRVHKFLNFWKDNIEATIKDVNVCFRTGNTYRNVDIVYKGIH